MSLYKPSTILPRDDYDAVVMYAKPAKAALEFGPGNTTLALFEARVPEVHSFEHDRKWFWRQEHRLRPLVPDGVKWALGTYTATKEELGIEFGGVYDLAVVDSPTGGDKWVGPPGREGHSRLNTLRCALAVASKVLLHDAERPGEQASLRLLGCNWHMVSGKMALCWM